MNDPVAPQPAGHATASQLILLHETDNVLVCRSDLRAGDTLLIDGFEIRAECDVPVGHKIARRALAAGERVYKYGAPIGSMTRNAAAGAHVHLHNMKSDYISSHTRQGYSDTAGGGH